MLPLECSLTEKYRPAQVADLVLPDQHGVAAALKFCEAPYPSSWLLHGRSGMGKSSLAEIMAKLASKHPFATQIFSGPDVTIDVVRSMVTTFTHRPLYGDLHSVIINESDEMPRIAQVRLLEVLERLKEYQAVFILTSNENLTNFEDRLLARVKPQSFTTQGIRPKAAAWLMKIAALEGIAITPARARRLVKLAKNSLRKALQDLEVFAAEQASPR